MKKVLSILILITGILLLNQKEYREEKEEETRAVFISYIELDKYVKKDTIEESKKNIRKMIEKLEDLNLNTIILQVRSEQDAIYDSNIFPYSRHISQEEGKKTFDVLSYFIEISHKKKIKVIAWVNPYRVRTSSNIESITNTSPAYPYINTDTIWIENGIFLNPSKKEVEDLIINGIKELVEYDIDGVLMDDYFYPSGEIDNNDYEIYIEKNGYMSKDEYHLEVISNMIKKAHQACQEKNIPFGVSPDGNIENNYKKHFADVKLWMRSKEYIDFIMPQIYYGFYNSIRSFTKTCEEWESLLKEEKINFYIALAFYKVGKEDVYAKEGKNEWLDNNDIIMREILLSRNLKNYKGFALFRFDSLFDIDNYTENSKLELENMQKIVK